MTSWIVRIYEAMRRHRVLALLSAVLLTAVLALSLARQTYKEDISDFLPLTDKYSKALRVYQDIAGADRIIVLFMQKGGAEADPDALTAAIDDFVQTLQERDEAHVVGDVIDRIDMAAFAEAEGLVNSSDTGALEAVIAAVIAADPDTAQAYRDGREKALNPLFVIILTPIVMGIFASLVRKGKGVSTPRKIALGMFIAGIAYLFLMSLSLLNGYPSGNEFRAMDSATMAAAGLHKQGYWVMFVVYFFLTVAELFISPLGLSFVSKVAPRHLQGLCQGLWLAATAIGNLFIFVGPLMYNAWPIWVCWTVFFAVCIVSMSIMLGMVKWLERVTA